MLGLVLYKWALETQFVVYSLDIYITKKWWSWRIHVGKFRLWAVIKLWSNGGSGGAPWWTYWSAGITNTIGPAMGIEALKYISYPAQVLAKSSKMIPGEVSMSITLDCSLFVSIKISLCILHIAAFFYHVVMLMGSLVYGIRYSLPEYLCTFLVAGGVSMFALLKVCRSAVNNF